MRTDTLSDPCNVLMFQIVAAILYIQPTTKLVTLSCLDHIVRYAGVPDLNRFGELEVGNVVEEGRLLRVDSNGVYLKLADRIRGFATVRIIC